MQVPRNGFVRFDHGLDEVMGTHLLKDSESQILPELESPIEHQVRLCNTDFSKCFVEVDLAGLSMTGERQRHPLAVMLNPNQDLRVSPKAHEFSTVGIPDPPPEPASS